MPSKQSKIEISNLMHLYAGSSRVAPRGITAALIGDKLNNSPNYIWYADSHFFIGVSNAVEAYLRNPGNNLYLRMLAQAVSGQGISEWLSLYLYSPQIPDPQNGTSLHIIYDYQSLD